MSVIAKIRRSDGRVVATISALDMPADNEKFYHKRTDKIDTTRVWRIGGNNRFYPVEVDRSLDVLVARYSELLESDKMMAPDRDPDPAWKAYRKALRDITVDGRTAKAMLKRFPQRPDGTDPVEHLK